MCPPWVALFFVSCNQMVLLNPIPENDDSPKIMTANAV